MFSTGDTVSSHWLIQARTARSVTARGHRTGCPGRLPHDEMVEPAECAIGEDFERDSIAQRFTERPLNGCTWTRRRSHTPSHRCESGYAEAATPEPPRSSAPDQANSPAVADKEINSQVTAPRCDAPPYGDGQ
jgi:hypothetical protein